MTEYTVSRRHDKTWNLKPWANQIHWFTLMGSSGECAGAWWMLRGHAGPLVLGVWSGEWGSCCHWDCGWALPCGAETPLPPREPMPHALWQLCGFSHEAVGLKVARTCCSWKVSRSKQGVALFQWKSCWGFFVCFFNAGYLVSVFSSCVTNPCFLSSLTAWASS